MVKTQKTATLNLGMQTVTMAVFEASNSGELTLNAFATADLSADPATDGSREGQLKVVLSELISKLGWKGREAACSVPSQGVFARFVSIPKIEGDKVEQMLHFEAQQNVPYPIEDVSWGFQVLPEREEGKLGALILATKLDQLEVATNALRAAGLTPSLIDTSPVALYNALRFNYPELQGCSLLIDIGARTTNLIFAEGDRLFIRTLPVGGSTITSALQKRFEGRPFAQVEEFKRAEGFIPPPGNYAGAGNADVAEAGKIARTVMTRIHNEITRSITFYRTSQHGAAPVRAFLAGGGASLPYTLEFFNEKLSLPIEFFNPLRRISVGPSVDARALASIAHRLGECTGLALQQLLGDTPLEIELKSPTLLREKAAAARRAPLAAAAALVVAGLALAGFHYDRGAQRIAALNEQFTVEINQLRGFENAFNKAAGEKKAMLADAADLAAAPVLRRAWASIIDELNASLPERNVWVTKLRPMSGEQVLDPGDGKAGWQKVASGRPAERGAQTSASADVTALVVEGLYLESEEGPAVVDRFVEQLAKSPTFGITAENKASVVLLRATPSGDKWAYDFKLVLPLARPIPL